MYYCIILIIEIMLKNVRLITQNMKPHLSQDINVKKYVVRIEKSIISKIIKIRFKY